MQVHYGISSYKNIKNPVITVGTFDGVHFGHQKIINRLCKIANTIDGESVLLTFDPHPRSVLFKDQQIQLINTLEEKIKLLEQLGLDHLVIYPFTKSFSKMSGKDYIKQHLIKELNVHTIVIGYDHHFGNDRSGNIELLRAMQGNESYQLEEIAAHEIDEISISSTKIRTAISNGQIPLVKEFLGYNYFLTGEIEKGDGIGKTLGFPTANLSISNNDKIIPKHGVYAVRVKIDNNTIDGIMNIGLRPTINNNPNDLRLEVHLFNFNESIYGKSLKVNLMEIIRDEIKFDDIESLKNQIGVDCEKAKKILQNI
jgi:riboflavin kinase / FMN adenylyltransferase